MVLKFLVSHVCNTGSGLSEAMVEITTKWSGNPMYVLDEDARDTGVGRRGNYEVQDALVDMYRYVDVLEKVVVIQNLCEVVSHLTRHRSPAVEVSADAEASRHGYDLVEKTSELVESGCAR